MISAVLPLALAVGSALGSAGNDENPIPTGTGIELHVDAYGFQAVNGGATGSLLVFEADGNPVVRALAAGERLSWPLPQGGTGGLTLEILTPLASGAVESRSMSLDLQDLTAGAPLLVRTHAAGATGFALTNSAATLGGSTATAPLGVARPASFHAASGNQTTEQAIFHVPSVTGLEAPATQEPPRMDDAPLPPI